MDGVIDTLGPTRDTPVDGPLLPTALRRPAVGVAAACAALLAALAVVVAGTSTATPVDAWAQRIVATHHALHGQWPSLAVVAGEPVTVVAVACVLAAWCARRRRWRSAVLAVLAPGLTGLLETGLKPLVGRTIATGALSFPSGHTAGATALGLTVTLVIAGGAQQRRELWVLVGTFLTGAGAVAVAVGLVAEHAHYPTDTIGGFCLAAATTVGCALAVDRAGRAAPHARRWRSPRPSR